MKKRVFVSIFLLFVLGCGLGFAINKQKPDPIKLSLKEETNTNPLQYEHEEFLKALESQFPEVVSLLDKRKSQKPIVIPGLKQTKSIHYLGKKADTIGLAKDMVPQGMTIIEDKYLMISAYSKSKKLKSILWLVDRTTGEYIKTIVLDDIDHVGALTYDDEHDRLWITTTSSEKGAKVESLSLAAIQNYSLEKDGKSIVFEEAERLSHIDRASYMTYHKDQLFVGYFDKEEEGHLASFPLDKEGKIRKDVNHNNEVIPVKTWKTDKKIQGMTFYKDKILLSQSYGESNSNLLVFDYNLEDGKLEFVKDKAILSLELPPYLQQIIGYQETIYALFESASKPYRKKVGDLQMDRILPIQFKELTELEDSDE